MLRREIGCSLRSITVPGAASTGVSTGTSPGASTGSAPVASSWLLVSIGRDAGGVVVLAVDDEERALPARLLKKVREDFAQLAQPLACRPALRRLHVERPVDHERAPFDQRARHRPPVTRVVRVVAVVPHGEVLPLGDRERTELIARAVRLGEERTGGIDPLVVENNVRLVELLPVDEHLLVADDHGLAG